MTAARVRFPIGHSNFRTLREAGLPYVDKTALLDELLAPGPEVFLLPRPRRFGKTLALSMVRYFLEKSAQDVRPLFAGLHAATSPIAAPHFQRYPVVFLTFKDIKSATWEDCEAQIGNVLSGVFGEHRTLLETGDLSPEDAAVFAAILGRRADRAACVSALRLLTRLLAEHHGEKVVLLLDEYDTPIHAGFSRGYYDQVVTFFRDFLSGALKDNEHLFRGVLTGILRVAKESLFSGLNNITVRGILGPETATAFGFTEAEVRDLAERAGRLALMDEIRSFYNGYLFGGVAIYNPWSVLCFLDSMDGLLRPYWIETSGNDLVRELLLGGRHGVREELETLLAGGTIERRIEENIVLRDVHESPGAVWSFLLFTGYLKPVAPRLVEGELLATLAVPNTEVAIALRRMARTWMERQLGGDTDLERMLAGLLAGDAPAVERYLGAFLQTSASFFDTARPEPERFYHGLVVGLLAGLAPTHEVRSNRESGLGRCDVLVLPRRPGEAGVALELKRVEGERGETVARALGAALRQVRAKGYAAEIAARGAGRVIEMAAVFDGKEAHVRVAGAKRPAAKKPAAKKPARKAAKPRGGQRRR